MKSSIDFGTSLSSVVSIRRLLPTVRSWGQFGVKEIIYGEHREI